MSQKKLKTKNIWLKLTWTILSHPSHQSVSGFCTKRSAMLTHYCWVSCTTPPAGDVQPKMCVSLYQVSVKSLPRGDLVPHAVSAFPKSSENEHANMGALPQAWSPSPWASLQMALREHLRPPEPAAASASSTPCLIPCTHIISLAYFLFRFFFPSQRNYLS